MPTEIKINEAKSSQKWMQITLMMKDHMETNKGHEVRINSNLDVQCMGCNWNSDNARGKIERI